MNATNLTNPHAECGSVKCQFSIGKRVVIIFFFFLIFLVSLVGNSVLFFAIIRHKQLRRSSTNFSFLSLSLANILITVFCIPVFVISIFIADKWTFGVIGCKLVSFLQTLAINAAVFTLVIIGVEKFLVVCFPFHVRSRRSKVRYLVLGGWIAGILQSSVYLRYKTVKIYNGIPYCIQDWPSFKTRQIFFVIEAVALRFVPLTFMTVLHVVTIMKITAKLKYRRANVQDDIVSESAVMKVVGSEALKNRKKAVVMLVFIVTAAAVTLFPYYCFNTFRLLAKPETHKDKYTYNIIYIVLNWLIFSNSVCHPIIFGLMSSKYRKAAKSTLSFGKSPGSSINIKKQMNRKEPMLMTEQGGSCPSASTQ